MTLHCTGAPTAEPVTLVQAKAFLRLSGSDEDELILALIRAAREDVERATGLALIDQTWRLALDDLPRNDTVLLTRNPVREILSVTIYGTEGETSIVDPADYQSDLVSRPARLLFVRRPTPMRVLNGLEVDFRSGFGEAGTDVPDGLKQAILVLVAHWFEFRAAYGAADQPVSYPSRYDRLLGPWRERRL